VLVEYPELLRDAEVIELLKHASGHVALSIAALQHFERLPTQLDELPPALRQLAAQRLAAPEFADVDEARGVLLEDLHKLRRQERRPEGEEVRSLMRSARDAGDVETELSLLQQLQERRGVKRSP
jgi:hypothetical protein